MKSSRHIYVKDINAKHYTSSLLNAAVANKNHAYEVINLLVANGCKSIDHKEYQYGTPLNRAMEEKSYGAIKALLQNGADLSLIENKWKSIVSCLRMENHHTSRTLTDCLHFAQELIRYGFDVNEKKQSRFNFY